MIPCRHTDHVATGLARLTEAYKSQRVIRGILGAYLAQVQAFELAAWDVITSRLLGEAFTYTPVSDTGVCGSEVDMSGAEETVVTLDASAAQLDLLGALVREERGGRLDPEYLLAIKARVVANRSAGRAEDILRILALSIPTGTPWTYSELMPATWLAQVYGFSGAGSLARILGDARSGATRGVLEYSPNTLLPNHFLFASAHGASAGDTHGYDSTYGGSLVSNYVGALEPHP